MKSDDFKEGARAMFDILLYRAANNYGNKQDERDLENKIIYEWAADALEDVSPGDYGNWKKICDLVSKIDELEKRIEKIISKTVF